MLFTEEHFHVGKAQHDHSVFTYEMDESSLAINLRGHYELGELSMIREALVEANRLFKHRKWVEVDRSVDSNGHTSARIVIWCQGTGMYGQWLDIPEFVYREHSRLCQEGHAADRGWLKKEFQ